MVDGNTTTCVRDVYSIYSLGHVKWIFMQHYKS